MNLLDEVVDDLEGDVRVRPALGRDGEPRLVLERTLVNPRLASPNRCGSKLGIREDEDGRHGEA